MKADNILAAIEKLGEIIIHNNNNISYLEYENKNLREKIEKLEQYIDFYTEQDITDNDYKEVIKWCLNVSKSK